MYFGFEETIPWYASHDECVYKVCRHLNNKLGCIKVASEEKISKTRRVDAWAYDSKKDTYYICEIKVRWTDAQKALLQLNEPTQTIRKKYPKSKVIPVLAIPDRLYDEMQEGEGGNWDDIRSMCKKSGIQIWLIEYRSVRSILATSSEKSTAVKPKATAVQKASPKTTAKKKITSTTKKPAKKATTKPKTSTTKKKMVGKKK